MKKFKCIKCNEVFEVFYLAKGSDCICKYCEELEENE